MIGRTILANKKYIGKYVALKSFFENRVIASGVDPIKVVTSAEKKGYFDAVLLFVPREKSIHFTVSKNAHP